MRRMIPCPISAPSGPAGRPSFQSSSYSLSRSTRLTHVQCSSAVSDSLQELHLRTCKKVTSTSSIVNVLPDGGFPRIAFTVSSRPALPGPRRASASCAADASRGRAPGPRATLGVAKSAAASRSGTPWAMRPRRSWPGSGEGRRNRRGGDPAPASGLARRPAGRCAGRGPAGGGKGIQLRGVFG